jgi:hypothetical protein
MPHTYTEDQLCERSELDRFFADVSYRVDLSERMQRSIDQKLATRFNAFSIIEPDENKLSDIIADLLDPKGTHGQGNLFLRALFEKLGLCTEPQPTEHAIVRREVPTDRLLKNRRRIDILIEAGVLIAIENKVDSLEQADQIKDYVDHLAECASSANCRSVLIYLTPNGRKPKSITTPKVEELQNAGLLHCWSYQTDLRDWLIVCRRECEAEKIRHFLSDFIAYIESDLLRDPETDDEPSTNDK